MRRTFCVRRRVGKSGIMVSGGLGRHGPYVYAGVKTKKGLSAGASIGTKGRQVYGSYNKKRRQVRIKHNLDTRSNEFRFR